MPTLKDVARKIGCSEATVSLVMNNRPGVNAETRKRVLAAAQELGYSPNSIARSLAMKRTSTIGLLVTDIENPFFGSLVHHISTYTQINNYALLVAASEDDFRREEELLQVFMARQADGIILVPTQLIPSDYTIFNMLERKKTPILFAVSYYPLIHADHVLTDYAIGSYRLTRYLLDLGHRNIVHLVGADLEAPINRERLNGFYRAFEETGLSCGPEQIVQCEQPVFLSGYSQTRRLLEHRRPDAIMAINDVLALGAKKAIEEARLSVPKDISVAGYDDVMFSSLFEKPLTTVRQDVDRIAQSSVELLIQKINSRSKLIETVLVEPELIVRQTTGPNR